MDRNYRKAVKKFIDLYRATVKVADALDDLGSESEVFRLLIDPRFTKDPIDMVSETSKVIRIDAYKRRRDVAD